MHQENLKNDFGNGAGWWCKVEEEEEKNRAKVKGKKVSNVKEKSQKENVRKRGYIIESLRQKERESQIIRRKNKDATERAIWE